ncbi:unnamed protein product [Spirodela intermedia]|uniref:Uncharacterized protein n=1 Tax=Spirodela intermedia TaxID=51605 RepID=A0A7I8JN49_SPIIN|nr:unnamed protein product [Spirodela intermedia]CAA6671231.1 unnamed protein product [Spirodela intermedia]
MILDVGCLIFIFYFFEGLFPHPPLIAYDFVYSKNFRPMCSAGMPSRSKWCLSRAYVGISCQEVYPLDRSTPLGQLLTIGLLVGIIFLYF